MVSEMEYLRVQLEITMAALSPQHPPLTKLTLGTESVLALDENQSNPPIPRPPVKGEGKPLLALAPTLASTCSMDDEDLLRSLGNLLADSLQAHSIRLAAEGG
jgi:hypothetical protein